MARCYITFPITYFALRAESLFQGTAYRVKLVPVPRSLSSSCGAALECDCPDLAAIAACLVHNQVEMEARYRVDGGLVYRYDPEHAEGGSPGGTRS